MMTRALVRLGGMATIGCALTWAAFAAAEHRLLDMLDDLDSGRWELRIRGDAQHVERICLRNGRALIQLRHPDLRCERLVIQDSVDDVTVQYTCRGRGYGRTHIRRESSQLIQLETQGVVGGLPFDFMAEGRRIGECAS